LERKGLGRGLGALIPGGPESAPGIAEVDVQAISLNPWQPRGRVNDDGIAELCASVKQHGVLQPVVVRPDGPGKYQLVAGERRLRAARMAGLSTIPAIVREMKDQESLEIALVENIQREDIGAIDAARAYRRLMDEFDLTQEQIASRVGKSRPAVANTLRLLQLPESVQARLEKGELSEGHARALLGVPNPNMQILLADEIARRKCSVREAERLARSWAKGVSAGGGSVSRETSPASADPNMTAVEEHLRNLFGTRVRVTSSGERGKIEIEFYGEDDLNRILGLIGGLYQPAVPGRPFRP